MIRHPQKAQIVGMAAVDGAKLAVRVVKQRLSIDQADMRIAARDGIFIGAT